MPGSSVRWGWALWLGRREVPSFGFMLLRYEDTRWAWSLSGAMAGESDTPCGARKECLEKNC